MVYFHVVKPQAVMNCPRRGRLAQHRVGADLRLFAALYVAQLIGGVSKKCVSEVKSISDEVGDAGIMLVHSMESA